MNFRNYKRHLGLTLLKKAFIKETAGKISIDEDAVNDLRIGSIPFLFLVFFCRFVCDKNAEIVQNQAEIDFLCILSGFDLNNAKQQEIKMTVVFPKKLIKMRGIFTGIDVAVNI